METACRLMLVLALLLPLAAGCGGSARTTRQPPQGDRAASAKQHQALAPPITEETRQRAALLWAKVERAREVGDAVTERRALQRLVRAAGGTVEAARARVGLAEDALRRRDPVDAERWLAPLAEEGAAGALEGPLRHAARRTLALAYEGQERYAEAAETWLAAGGEAQDDPGQREATEGAARSQFLDGRPGQARQTLEEAGQDALVVRELVAGRLTGRLLAELVARVDAADRDLPWLLLEHARARCGRADLAGCRASAERAAGAGDQAVRPEAEALLARVAAWDEVSTSHVGVLLPLSGPYQSIGQAALEGIQIALAGKDSGVRLVVRDTRGEAEVAAAQVEELVLDRHVVGILGPVGEKETRAAALAAARFGVPLVALSSSPEAVAEVPRSLRVRLSAPEQATSLARHAVTALGVRRVAILFPQDVAGERAMGAFWDEVVRLGAEVRAVEAFEPGTKKFGPVIKALIGASRPGSGVHDFEALFIPDDALSVRRLVPFLKYWGLRVKTAPHVTGTSKHPAVQLLGGAGWNHPSVIDRGDNLTDNAIFVDAFVHDPEDLQSDRFAKAFFQRYQRKPTTFHAEVRDAAALLGAALASVEGADHAARGALWEALLGVKHFRGVTGDMTLLDDGRVVRKPRLLTIHLDDIRPRLGEEEEEWLRRAPGSERGPR